MGATNESGRQGGCRGRLWKILRWTLGVLVVLGVVIWFSFWSILGVVQDRMLGDASIEVTRLAGSSERTERTAVRFDAMLRGRQVGGAVLASLGPDGAVLVDAFGSEVLARKALATLETLAAEQGGSGAVELVVSTHPHPDHVGGNAALAAAGAEIVGHASTARWMGRSLRPVPFLPKTRPYPAEALPGTRPETLVEDARRIELDGETLHVENLGPAHTESDLVVWFVEAGVVHVGDLFHGHGSHGSASWINGGAAAGHLRAVDRLLALLPEDVQIVGGHSPPGSTSTRAELARYREILGRALAEVDALETSERSGEQVEDIAARLEAEFPDWFDREEGEPAGIMHGGAAGWVRNLSGPS